MAPERKPALPLQLILDSVPVGLVQIDENRRYLWANPAFLSFIGYSLEELRGRTLFDVTYPEDVSASREVSERLRRPGCEVRRIEKRYVRKDGEIVWGLVTSRQVTNPATGGLDIFTVIEDITELKRRERELLRAEAEMASFFLASADFMLSFDFEGRILRVNPSGSELLGLSQEQIVGKHVEEFVHPDDLQISRDELGRLALGANTLRFENRCRTHDGTYRLISWTAVPSRHAGAIYAVGRDVTERRKEQATMIYSAKMASLGEMAGGLAHEVNNPLAIILGKAITIRTMLDEKPAPIREIREELVTIERTGQRIATIIRGLRAFSRDAVRDPMTRVDVGSICDDTLSLCAERLKSHNVALNVTCSTGFQVRGRPSQLSQVLMNLISNAFDAVEALPKPRIDVVTSRGPGSVIIEVRDNGPGVDPAVIDKIFQPFFTTKEVGRGTGLGLSISKGIIEEHGGELSYARENGQSVFRIVLPEY